MGVFVNDQEFMELEQLVFEKTNLHISQNDPIFVVKILIDHWKDKFAENFEKKQLALANVREGRETALFDKHIAKLNEIVAKQESVTDSRASEINKAFGENLEKTQDVLDERLRKIKEHLDDYFSSQQAEFDNFFANKATEFTTELAAAVRNEHKGLTIWQQEAYQAFNDALLDCFSDEKVQKIFDTKAESLNKLVDSKFERVVDKIAVFNKDIDNDLQARRAQLALDADIFLKRSEQVVKFAKDLDKVEKQTESLFKQIKYHNIMTLWSSVLVAFLFILAMILIK